MHPSLRLHMGKVVNKAELSEILGVSQRTLTTWQEEPGFPIVELAETRGLENSYDTAAVVQWYVLREVSKSSETDKTRRRLLAAQAEAKERENLVAAGKLISARECEKTLEEIARDLRDALLDIPPLAALEIEFDKNRHSIETKLNRHIRRALDNFSARMKAEADRVAGVGRT